MESHLQLQRGDDWSTLTSAVVGAADDLFGFARRIKSALGFRSGTLFQNGFGDVPAAVAPWVALRDKISAGGGQPSLLPPPERVVIAVPATRSKPNGGTTLLPSALLERELRYQSPWAPYLPPETRTARALAIGTASQIAAFACALTATGSADGVEIEGAALSSSSSSPSLGEEVVVHMPAFGEEGYGSRLKAARTLATRRGGLQLIVIAPFYSRHRRRIGQRCSRPMTVADFMTQAYGVSAEAAMLVLRAAAASRGCKGAGPFDTPPPLEGTAKGLAPLAPPRLLITGFSFGAAMTGTAGCLAAALMRGGADHRRRLALAPAIGSSTPAALLDGVLSAAIDWPALEGSFNAEWRGDVDKTATLGACMRSADVMAARDGASLLAALLNATQTGEIIAAAAAGEGIPVPPLALAALPLPPPSSPSTGGTTGAGAMPSTTAASTAPRPLLLFAAFCGVVAEHDAFMRAWRSREQHALLASVTAAPSPPSSRSSATAPATASTAFSVAIGGGHISAFARRQQVFVSAVCQVAEALQRSMEMGEVEETETKAEAGSSAGARRR